MDEREVTSNGTGAMGVHSQPALKGKALSAGGIFAHVAALHILPHAGAFRKRSEVHDHQQTDIQVHGSAYCQLHPGT